MAQRKLSCALLIGLFLSPVVLRAQCLLIVDTVSNPTPQRTGAGNGSLTSTGWQQPSNLPYAIIGNWSVRTTTVIEYLSLGTWVPVTQNETVVQWTPMTPRGAGSRTSVTTVAPLQSYGGGSYRATIKFWAACGTGGTYQRVLQGDVNSTSITVSRPAAPDYMTGSPALWFLGSGVLSNGPYSSVTTLRAGATNGATDTPTWIVSSGSDKVDLSCTTCALPSVTALKASGGCQIYDVVVQTSYGGFRSEPMVIFINRPWSAQATFDPATGQHVFTEAVFNGYLTKISYETKHLCTNETSMHGYSVNEAFGTRVPVYPGTNWPYPQAESDTLPLGVSIWQDHVSFWVDDVEPDFPAYCTPTALCIPPYSNPNVGPHLLVDETQQSWFIGSSTPGVGARIMTNILQRYTNSGWHNNPITPNP